MTDMDITAPALSLTAAGTENPQKYPTLHDCVTQAMQNYFVNLDGQPATHVYDMVISSVEAALLESVMLSTRGNQTTAAAMLGVNRGTLRKKLKQYHLI